MTTYSDQKPRTITGAVGGISCPEVSINQSYPGSNGNTAFISGVLFLMAGVYLIFNDTTVGPTVTQNNTTLAVPDKMAVVPATLP